MPPVLRKNRSLKHPTISFEELRMLEDAYLEHVEVEENEDDYNVDFLINLEERTEDCDYQ